MPKYLDDNGLSYFWSKIKGQTLNSEIIIGGRNLVVDSIFTHDSQPNDPQYTTIYRMTSLGLSLFDAAAHGEDIVFTVSFDYELVGDYSEASSNSRIYAFTNGAAIASIGEVASKYVAGTPPTGHYSRSFKLTSAQSEYAITNSASYIRVRWNTMPAGCSIKVSHFKLEVGNKETAWTPAPEDLSPNLFAYTLEPSHDRLPQLIEQDTPTNECIDSRLNISLVEHGLKVSGTSALKRPHVLFGRPYSDSIPPNSLQGLTPGHRYALSANVKFKFLSGTAYSSTAYSYLRYGIDWVDSLGVYHYGETRSDAVTITKANRGVEMSECRFTWTFKVPDDAKAVSLIVYCSNATENYYAAGDYIQLSNIVLVDTEDPVGYRPPVKDLVYKYAPQTFRYVTPQMFGAYADGTSDSPHDDTDAIQAALDSALEVYFPPGVYMISRTLDIHHNAHLFGNAAGYSKIRAMSGFTGSFMAQVAPFDGEGIPQKTHFCIERLEFSCNNVDVGGLYLARPYNASTVRDVLVTKCFKTAIWVGDTRRKANDVDPNNEYRYILSTSDSRSQTLVIDNCYFIGSDTTDPMGPMAYFYNSFELNLKDTKFLNETAHMSSYPCVHFDFCYDFYVRGCSFLKTTKHAVAITRNCRYFRLIGNTYENVAYQTTYPAILCDGYTRDGVGGTILQGIIIESTYYNVSRTIGLSNCSNMLVLGSFRAVDGDVGTYSLLSLFDSGTLTTKEFVQDKAEEIIDGIWDPTAVEEKTVETQANSNVSPWGAVGAVNLATSIASKGNVMSFVVLTNERSNPASACLRGTLLEVYSRTAATNIKVRVYYEGAAQWHSVTP